MNNEEAKELNNEEAKELIDTFAAANRAVAWAEAGGDEADKEDVAALDVAEANLLKALTQKG
jgi:hypothetical protein